MPGEVLPHNERESWVFPNTYLSDMLTNHLGIVRASLDRTSAAVTGPVRQLINHIYPELNSRQETVLLSKFLNRVKASRKRATAQTGGIILASERKSKSGGRWG